MSDSLTRTLTNKSTDRDLEHLGDFLFSQEMETHEKGPPRGVPSMKTNTE